MPQEDALMGIKRIQQSIPSASKVASGLAPNPQGVMCLTVSGVK